MVQILDSYALPESMVELGIAIETEFDDAWMMDPDCPNLKDTGRSLMDINLDNILARQLPVKKYPNLRKVHIELLLHEREEVNENQLQKDAPLWFPLLTKRGVLSTGVSEVCNISERRFSSVLSPI